MPPVVRPQTGRGIRLENVDRGVKMWFEKTVAASVATPSGEPRKVSVLFSAGERWVAAADQRGIRDKDGRLILPVISIRRTGIDPNSGMSALALNVPRLQISRQVSQKNATLANNDLSRPISQRRLRQARVYDIWTIPFPFNGLLRYEVTIQAQYTTQMNEIIEKIVSSLEFFDVPSFVFDVEFGVEQRDDALHDGKGARELSPAEHAHFDSREPLDSYYCVGYLEGDFGDAGNLQEFTDQERIVEMTIPFKVPTVLQLDPAGNRPAVQKDTTAFQVKLGEEAVVSVDDPYELDFIFKIPK